MKPTDRGYACAPGYLTELVRSLRIFHDPDAEHLIPQALTEADPRPRRAARKHGKHRTHPRTRALARTHVRRDLTHARTRRHTARL